MRSKNNGAFEKYSGLFSESLDLTSKAMSLFTHGNVKLNGEAKESGRVTAPPSTFMDGGSDHVSSSNEALGLTSSSGRNDRAASVPICKSDQINLLKDGYQFTKNSTEPPLEKNAKNDRVSDSEQDETIDSLGCNLTGNIEPYRYQQEAALMNLKRVDSVERQKENRFSCPFCGKCVRSKENLKLHIRKHTGERPFVCLFCGRAFGGKSDLTRHLRIHTGERPYHCEICGKCFARADYLSKHLTTHLHSHNSFSQTNR